MRISALYAALCALVTTSVSARSFQSSPRHMSLGSRLAARSAAARAKAQSMASLPLAYAIPGHGIAETIFVDGTFNFLTYYNYAVTARILLSWFPQAQGIAALRPLYLLTDPFLNLFRGLGLQFAGIDFSVLPAFFLLSATTNAIVSLGDDEVPAHLATRPRRGVNARPQPLPAAQRDRLPSFAEVRGALQARVFDL